MNTTTATATATATTNLTPAPASLPAPGAWIGLDWGHKEHAFALHAAPGVPEEGTLPTTAEALHAWLHTLEQRFGGRPVAVGLETSRGAVIHALLQYPLDHDLPHQPRHQRPLPPGLHPLRCQRRLARRPRPARTGPRPHRQTAPARTGRSPNHQTGRLGRSPARSGGPPHAGA